MRGEERSHDSGAAALADFYERERRWRSAVVANARQ